MTHPNVPANNNPICPFCGKRHWKESARRECEMRHTQAAPWGGGGGGWQDNPYNPMDDMQDVEYPEYILEDRREGLMDVLAGLSNNNKIESIYPDESFDEGGRAFINFQGGKVKEAVSIEFTGEYSEDGERILRFYVDSDGDGVMGSDEDLMIEVPESEVDEALDEVYNEASGFSWGRAALWAGAGYAGYKSYKFVRDEARMYADPRSQGPIPGERAMDGIFSKIVDSMFPGR